MGIINKIKGLFGGDPHEETARAAGAPVDSYLGTQVATPGAGADVFVPETDPALDSVETAGSSTPPKPQRSSVSRIRRAAEGVNDGTFRSKR